MLLGMAIFAKAVHNWYTIQNRKLEVQLYNINQHLTIDDHIDEMLDSMIRTCCEEYVLTKTMHLGSAYINQQMEIDMNKEVLELVVQRLSPVFTQQLTLLYNEGSITDIIAKRVYFEITNFVINHNKGYNS